MRRSRVVQHRAAREWPPSRSSVSPPKSSLHVARPELDRRIGPHDPLAIGLVQQDRDAAERFAPLDHAGVVVRMGDRDRAHRRRAPAPPRPPRRRRAGSCPRARCPRRLGEQHPLADRERGLDADAEVAGVVPHVAAVVAASSSSVVHCWPPGPTYWRSSSQIGHRSGGWLGCETQYCVAQVRQTKCITGSGGRSCRRARRRRARPRCPRRTRSGSRS